jgi:hypothetical protein
MAGYAEFANQEDVEGCAECRRHFVGYRHAPPRQRQDDDVTTVPVVAQKGGKDPTGVPAVAKEARRARRMARLGLGRQWI